ncbi:HNH endonuclease [Sporosarcina cyprini]|uniref:HNH endonuclease n=1 Tax=Sporosarcina cyprini TaxID=2910523 RepID=UPI001EDDFEE1|nr:HNH endonuclease [Sporosarcina cyprini]MCG3088505.1 HNH endonuclease [Sporosarcina cyprini]
MLREEFIEKIFGYDNRNSLNSIYHDAYVILDSEQEYQLFINEYWGKDSSQKERYPKLYQGAVLRKYRKDKIKRLNITKQEFLIEYDKCGKTALQNLFQESVRDIHMKGFFRMLGEESVELVFDTFSFRKEERLLRMTTASIRSIYELEKRFYLREQSRVKLTYKSENDISIVDVENFDTFNTKNHSEKEIMISRLVRDTALTKKLKELYENECQICTIKLKSPRGLISEVHHIRPYNKTHKGDDAWGNMIVLCPNCHSQFDNLYFAIHPGTIILHCVDEDHPYHGKKIVTRDGHKFELIYLEYTWEKFIDIQNNLARG